MPRPTIRGQILVPVLAVQAAVTAVLALIAATSAARRVESEVGGRLSAVLATLGRSSFPLNRAVLEAMRGLSGADFVAIGPGGAIGETTLEGLSALPDSFRSLPAREGLEPPGRSPILELGGRGYFAASVRTPSGPTLLVLYPESAWRRARWDAALPPVAVGLGGLIATAGVTGLVAHRLGRRLRTLEGKTAAIASGDFRPLDPGPRRDEVGDLAESINRMSSRLKAMRDAIGRTERARVLAQLAAGVAHGLRNAATGARMAIQIHARRCPLRGDESLDVALRQLSLGEARVKTLLALGSPVPTEPAACDASAIVADVAALVEPACRHARVALHIGDEKADSVPIIADAEGLRDAILNLALNAIDAAGPGGEVVLETHPGEAGGATIAVIDTGPGPPPELAGSLFEPFVTGKPEGVGLGLSVARRVAEDHGGRLEWGRADGRTRFVFTVPGGREATIPP